MSRVSAEVQTWLDHLGRTDEQSTNIAAALLCEHKADPLSKRLDRVMIGNPTARGDVNIFAVYAPFGDKEPFFHTHVSTEAAAQEPAEQHLQRLEQINRERSEQAQARDMETQTQAPRGPRMVL